MQSTCGQALLLQNTEALVSMCLFLLVTTVSLLVVISSAFVLHTITRFILHNVYRDLQNFQGSCWRCAQTTQ